VIDFRKLLMQSRGDLIPFILLFNVGTHWQRKKIEKLIQYKKIKQQ